MLAAEVVISGVGWLSALIYDYNCKFCSPTEKKARFVTRAFSSIYKSSVQYKVFICILAGLSSEF
jgi:hypothetical protein